MKSRSTWLITGASKGLGLSLTRQLLDAGYQVAATSRNKNALIDAVGAGYKNFLPLQVDLANEKEVKHAIDEMVNNFGRIDVLINNAGYGIGGSIEELSDKETRDSFDINVFGTINTIRYVLPHMRAQQDGHIINISSIAGITGNTGWAVYASTKFALVGLSEVLAQDVASFGIKVTVVAPGAFRTSFLSQDSLSLTANPIEAYEEVRASHKKYLSMDGAQAGDPEKAASAMIKTALSANPPLHLLLGSDAYERAGKKLEVLKDAFAASEEIARSTDY